MSEPEPGPDGAVDGPQKTRAGRDLPAALLVGFSLFALVIAGMIFWPIGVALLLALLALVGCIELYQALGIKGPLKLTLGFAPVIAFSGMAAVFGPDWRLLPFWLCVVALFAAMVLRLWTGIQGYIRDVSVVVFIILYVPGLASFISPVLLMDEGSAKMAAIFLCVCACDVGGYALGATLGKHKLSPNISPKKTWEGLIGSVLLAALVSGLAFHFLLGQPWWLGLLFALLLTVFGTLGDLVESAIKRDLGVKDMSSFLPGHGGIMDRLDSMLVGIPAGWLFFALAGL